MLSRSKVSTDTDSVGVTDMDVEGSGSGSGSGYSRGPQLDIQGGRHPMLEFTMSQRYDYNTLQDMLHQHAASACNKRWSP